MERLLARLPPHSHYKATIDDDDQFAALALARHGAEPPSPGTVPLAGYSDLSARLDNIFDAVNAVNETLIAVYAAKQSARPRPHRAPRPLTAYQRLLRHRKQRQLSAIEQRMTGGR